MRISGLSNNFKHQKVGFQRRPPVTLSERVQEDEARRRQEAFFHRRACDYFGVPYSTTRAEIQELEEKRLERLREERRNSHTARITRR